MVSVMSGVGAPEASESHVIDLAEGDFVARDDGAAESPNSFAGASTVGVAFDVSGDANPRLQIKADGTIEIGDGTNAVDTNLKRSAANTLATDDSFSVGATLTAGASSFAAAGTSAVGDSAAEGAASTFARSDHTHGRESFASPTAVSWGDASADGAATSLARSDHSHGLPTTVDATLTFADGVNLAVDTTTGTQIGTASTQKIGFFGATPVAQPSAYTPSNVTTDRSYDANSTTIDEIADVLGTLIADLQSLGLVG